MELEVTPTSLGPKAYAKHLLGNTATPFRPIGNYTPSSLFSPEVSLFGEAHYKGKTMNISRLRELENYLQREYTGNTEGTPVTSIFIDPIAFLECGRVDFSITPLATKPTKRPRKGGKGDPNLLREKFNSKGRKFR